MARGRGRLFLFPELPGGHTRWLECAGAGQAQLPPLGEKALWDPSSAWQEADGDIWAHKAAQAVPGRGLPGGRVEGGRKERVLTSEVTAPVCNRF